MKFDLKTAVSTSVSGMVAYAPGEQPEGGSWTKLNTNELPYPPSPKVKAAILKELGKRGESLRLYPAPESPKLREAIAKFYGLKAPFAFAGNGSDDVLNIAVRAFSDSKRAISTIDPSYSLYPVLAKMQGARLKKIPFEANMQIPFKKIFESNSNIFFFTNPNAPTGLGFDLKTVEKIAKNFNGLVLVDEAYAPFSGFSAAQLVKKYDNLIVAGTSSKAWGMAGMRVGWALANPKIVEILDRVRASYNLDRLAQAAGIAALNDVEYHLSKVRLIVSEREKFQKFLSGIGWNFYPSSSNFIFFKPRRGTSEGAAEAEAFFEFLKKNKILLRYFPNEKSACDGVRMTVGTPADMARVRKAVREWIKL